MEKDKMREADEEVKKKLQAELENLRRMQAKEGEVNLMEQAVDDPMTLSQDLNDLWQMSERCMEELEWTPHNIEESGEAKAHETIVQAMFARCQSIRENLQIILDTVREL